MRIIPPGKDDPGSGDPIFLLAVDQVPHDVEGAPGPRALVAGNPSTREIPEKRRQDGWCSLEDADRFVELESPQSGVLAWSGIRFMRYLVWNESLCGPPGAGSRRWSPTAHPVRSGVG